MHNRTRSNPTMLHSTPTGSNAAAVRRAERVFPWFCLLLAFLATGCRSLPWHITDEKVIAAREQGRVGLDLVHKGKLAEAEARFKNALKRCPKDCNLRRDLSRVLWKRGEKKQAIEELHAAVADSADQPAWRSELGTMLLEAGDVDQAYFAAEESLKQAPGLSAAWKLRGDVLRQKNNLNAALRDYHRALTLAPDSVDTLMAIADIYRLQGRPRRALATLERIDDSVTPDNRPERLAYLKGIALKALNRHEEAIEQFDEAYTLKPHPDILVQLVEAQWSEGRIADARANLQRVAAQRPNDPRVRALISQLNPSTIALAGHVAATQVQ